MIGGGLGRDNFSQHIYGKGDKPYQQYAHTGDYSMVPSLAPGRSWLFVGLIFGSDKGI